MRSHPNAILFDQVQICGQQLLPIEEMGFRLSWFQDCPRAGNPSLLCLPSELVGRS
jgi:hypothetical protein